jgi:hypothetical protein
MLKHKGNVHVYRARLIPFWFNVTVVITDGQYAIGAAVSAFQLKYLVKRWTKAGFEVRLHRSWFFTGFPFSYALGGNPSEPRHE